MNIRFIKSLIGVYRIVLSNHCAFPAKDNITWNEYFNLHQEKKTCQIKSSSVHVPHHKTNQSWLGREMAAILHSYRTPPLRNSSQSPLAAVAKRFSSPPLENKSPGYVFPISDMTREANGQIAAGLHGANSIMCYCAGTIHASYLPFFVAKPSS